MLVYHESKDGQELSKAAQRLLHYITRAGMDGILERPEIQLMHRLVIDVRRYRLSLSIGHAVGLLFVSDEMFRGGDDASALYPRHRFEDECTGKVGIGRDSFPNSTTCDHSSQGANHGAEQDIDAFGAKLVPHPDGSL